MALDFPTGVTINYIHSTGGRSWIWNGFGWDSYNRGVTGIQGPQGFPGVTGAQGATGASPTDYVAFVNGLKGVIGLSAGLGILLGTSGNTFIITNTGVTSINGSTGAIANVAFTNAANTFSVMQVMAAGLSALGITLSGNIVPISSLMNVIGGVSAFGATFTNRVVLGGVELDPLALTPVTPVGLEFVRTDETDYSSAIIRTYGYAGFPFGEEVGHNLIIETPTGHPNNPGGVGSIILSPGGTAVSSFIHDGPGGSGHMYLFSGANDIFFANDSTSQRTAYYSSNFGNKISDAGGNIIQNPYGMITNNISNLADFGTTGGYRLFLLPFFFDKKTEIRRIATVQGGNPVGHTGALRFCVYGTSLGTGLPWTCQYQSSNINLNQVAFQRYAATPNITISPGTYWIGFVLDMVAKTGPTYSWGVIANCSEPWEDYGSANRLFNNGQLNHIRYGMTAMDCPTPFSGTSFASAYTYSATVSASPATAGFGVSEMYSGSRCPWVGISVRQFGLGMNG